MLNATSDTGMSQDKTDQEQDTSPEAGDTADAPAATATEDQPQAGDANGNTQLLLLGLGGLIKSIICYALYVQDQADTDLGDWTKTITWVGYKAPSEQPRSTKPCYRERPPLLTC